MTPSQTAGKARGSRSIGLFSINAMGGLTLAALITLLFLVGQLVMAAAKVPSMAATLPLILAGLIASSLILFRHWWRGRQMKEAAQGRMAYLLDHDRETRLLNRAGFLAELERLKPEANDQGALICVGLGRMTEVVNSLGDICADEVIAEVTRRLVTAFDGCGLVGRVAEDTFVVFYRTSGTDRSELLSGRINQLINMPIDTVSGRISIGASLGVTFVNRPMEAAADCLRQARLALAAAQGAAASIAIFEPEMDGSRALRMALETELREALTGSGLKLVYQPQINEKGALIGVEALIRWDNPARGAVPPTIFIPIAEACGLAEAVGRFVLDQAFADSRRWPGLKMAVNVSPVQLRSDRFVSVIQTLLERHQVDPAAIELEITEGVLMENNTVVLANLEAVRKLGFSLALDDFGTGYSGLSYLAQFKVDKIKIDRSFVSPLGSRSEAAPIIRAITELSDAVGVKVLAEGVETRQQLETLRDQGCNQAQGFYVGRPAPASEIDALLEAMAGDRRAA